MWVGSSNGATRPPAKSVSALMRSTGAMPIRRAPVALSSADGAGVAPAGTQTASNAASSSLRRAVAELLRVAPVADALAARLAEHDHALALVGGSIRDALLGRLGNDLDFATDARPDEVLTAVQGWADATWTTGI